jgi:alanyl-tRNA synthetase
MINTLVNEMGGFYPELRERKDYVLNVVQDEENRFIQTLDQGTELLNAELARLKSSGKKSLSGEIIFKLYDTYGFPVDLTRLMAEEQHFQVDEAGFETEMQTAREKAKASWKGKGLATDEAHLIQWSNTLSRDKGTTQFSGYDHLNCSTKIVGLSNGQAEVTQLKSGDQGIIVTTETSFYGEGGGQVGDKGYAKSGTAVATVHNTTKQNDIYLHHVEVTAGEFKVGADLQFQVAESERRQTASNHSATHILHAALRKTLGTHVTQAGSLVDATRLRFDFTHPKSLTADEIQTIEAIVNEEIGKGLSVSCVVKSHEEAIKDGAMALFGEKYGNEVRVVKMGDFSQELCGGTHISNTAQIRLFKIVSESGVSAGVRRMEAISGDVAVNFLSKHYQQAQAAREAIGAQEPWNQFLESKSTPITDWIEEKKQAIKGLEREIKDLKKGQINIDVILASAKTFAKGATKGRYVVATLDVDDRDLLAQITDQLKNRIESGLVVTVGLGTDSHPVIVAATKDINPGINAGQVLKDLSQQLGGKGGGRPDFAQGAIVKRDAVASTLETYLKG